MWLLETVLTSPSSAKLWTPAVRKRALPIDMALPEKWVHLAGNIETMQQQILELIDFSETDIFPTAATFLHVPMKDSDVRQFLRDDLAKLQALGFEIILPAWLKELKQTKMRVRVSAGNASTKKVAGLDDILTFKWQFSMNGEEMSAEQFRKPCG